MQQIQKDLADIKASMIKNLDFENYVACPVSYGGASGSGDGGQAAAPAAPGEPAQPAVAVQDPSLDIPWQIGDGRGEAQHQQPVTLSDAVKGKFDEEP